MTALPIKLDRDLVFLDTETTGTDLTIDRIVEIAIVRVRPDGERVEYRTLVNPEMPIPEESRRVHGISDRDVEGAPTFIELAPTLLQRLHDADFSGYNILRFDLPLLRNEFQRARIEWSIEGSRVIDSQVIFHRMEPRDLSAAYRKFCGKPLEGAHGALADTIASVDVLFGELEHYADLPRDITSLDAMFNPVDRRFVDGGRKFKWRDGEVCFNFGNHRGRLLREIALNEPHYLDWIIGKDFPADVKKLAKDAQKGIFPEPPPEVAGDAAAPASHGATAGEIPSGAVEAKGASTTQPSAANPPRGSQQSIDFRQG